MRIHLVLLLFILLGHPATAQDTIQSFLDKDFNTTTGEDYAYIRTMISNNDQVTIQDKTPDGLKAGYYEYIAQDQLVQHGYSEFYLAPGVLYSSGYYENGIMKGEWKYYPVSRVDSMVVVNYDEVYELLIDPDCMPVKASASNLENELAWRSVIDIFKTLDDHFESNLITPGSFLNNLGMHQYSIDLVLTGEGKVRCPVFDPGHFVPIDMRVEIMRVLSSYQSGAKSGLNLKFTVSFWYHPERGLKPEFPGGNKAFKEFVKEHIQYPPVAKDMGLEGVVVVSAVVGVDGMLRDFVVRQTPFQILSEEVKRVLILSPQWVATSNSGIIPETRVEFLFYFETRQTLFERYSVSSHQFRMHLGSLMEYPIFDDL